MANIATVQVAAFLRPGVPAGRVTSHAMLRAMTRYFGRSYCVPAWGYRDDTRRVVETQHGEKGCPTGPEEAWRRYGRDLEPLWVRWYDGGSDFDTLIRFNETGYADAEECRYGFDALRVRTLTAAPQLPGSGWVEGEPNEFVLPLAGSYRTENDRTDFPAHFGPARPGLTTPARAWMTSRRSLGWEHFNMPDRVCELEPVVMEHATDIEFLWRGRPVRVYHKLGDRWLRWCLDHWDNCVNPAWLAFLAARSAGRGTLAKRLGGADHGGNGSDV